ncbi:MarR family winged helix-turn-helix transcriptional regulator [Marinovum sp.]|uniref:MarR family winged helix-turn-helix transcriptional regulator n=1 Tax=Marinovum sp. TaxID=2024839 RepID=UPI002B26CACB|nr:MarR family transcriptional regulator [Marinovum sp.]
MAITSKELEIQLERVRKLESNVTFQFSIVAKLMEMDAMNEIKDTPLNLTGYRLLRTVQTFERISMADLSRHMVTDNAQISRTAADLRKQGLVDFEADPTSKRRKIVILTEAGEDLLRSLDPRFKKRQEAVRECLGDDLRASLAECFERLTAHFSR